uniref:Uncharacterized protein n=1 Tax=Rhizophora mucronata TaxID=61149 RepID=A0A2P2LNP2_RHIMU
MASTLSFVWLSHVMQFISLFNYLPPHSSVVRYGKNATIGS